jgi:hypothetical protein
VTIALPESDHPTIAGSTQVQEVATPPVLVELGAGLLVHFTRVTPHLDLRAPPVIGRHQPLRVIRYSLPDVNQWLQYI